MEEETQYGEEEVPFWDRGDRFTVVGDWLGRVPAVELLNPQLKDRIVDAGCGTGWVARRIAVGRKRWELGTTEKTSHMHRSMNYVTVYGCDSSDASLAVAEREEREARCGNPITYTKADITERLPYDDCFCTGVICTAVLIHIDPKGMLRFFEEAYRILEPEGRIVISVMHPDLFWQGSPARKGRALWTWYKPLEPEVDRFPVLSGKFKEWYVDKYGHSFESVVWRHSEAVIIKYLTSVGFTIAHTQSTYVTRDILQHGGEHWQGGPVGYPAFWQVKAVK